MTDFQGIAQRYVDVWNETDPAARRKLVQDVFEAGAVYVDPLADVDGHDGVDALLGRAQQQFAGLVFRLGEGVDGHHRQLRCTWELGPAGGEAVVVGFDVIVLGADDRIRAVYGFLDKVPAA